MNVALVVTREFVILGVTEFGFSGVIIGAVELLANSICGTGETRSFCKEKMSHSLNCFFLLTTTFCLTNSSILFIISVLLTFDVSVLEIYI